VSPAFSFRVMALCDVSNGADPLDETASVVANSVRDHVQVFDGAILQLHTAIELELLPRSAEHLEKQWQVLWVNAVSHGSRRHRLRRVKSADPAGLFGESQFVCSGSIAKTPGRAQALCSLQLRLASSERLLGLCAFDLRWKAKRLSTDAEGLRTLQSRLIALQEQAADVAQHLPSQLNQPGR